MGAGGSRHSAAWLRRENCFLLRCSTAGPSAGGTPGECYSLLTPGICLAELVVCSLRALVVGIIPLRQLFSFRFKAFHCCGFWICPIAAQLLMHIGCLYVPLLARCLEPAGHAAAPVRPGHPVCPRATAGGDLCSLSRLSARAPARQPPPPQSVFLSVCTVP